MSFTLISVIFLFIFQQLVSKKLDASSTSLDAQSWLVANRFDNWTSTFNNFAGVDLLRLTRAELIEICGLLDGIRLYNGLHSKYVKINFQCNFMGRMIVST